MGQEKHLKTLSNFEWQIMNQVWDLKTVSARVVLEKLPKNHQRAYTTIQTYLERLVEKKYLKKLKVGLANAYSPLMPRDKIVAIVTQEFVDTVFRGDRNRLLHFLAGQDQLSLEEVAETEVDQDGRKDGWANY